MRVTYHEHGAYDSIFISHLPSWMRNLRAYYQLGAQTWLCNLLCRGTFCVQMTTLSLITSFSPRTPRTNDKCRKVYRSVPGEVNHRNKSNTGYLIHCDPQRCHGAFPGIGVPDSMSIHERRCTVDISLAGCAKTGVIENRTGGQSYSPFPSL